MLKVPLVLALQGFNSQPPEGGWLRGGVCDGDGGHRFQLTAARRRLGGRKNAGRASVAFQLTAARRRLVDRVQRHNHIKLFQLTAARRRLEQPEIIRLIGKPFQLTAARRRLVAELG